MVIVIGATGFIGMYTVDRFLGEGYEVLATGRNAIMKQELEAKGVTCVSLDISKKKILTNYRQKVQRVSFYWQVCFRQMHRWISVQMRMPQTISALMQKEPLMYQSIAGRTALKSDFHQQLCRCKKCMEERRCFKRDRAERFYVYRRPCGICDFQKCSQ